jgi:23S rRNA (cytosine1962-C5)-methyltransferase
VSLHPLRLRKNEERRLRAGHLWVFSNEVDVERTPLTAFEAGEPVDIQDSAGRSVGAGYVNPRSLICARLVTRGAAEPLARPLLAGRITRALRLREALFPEPFYRLIYGESDGLPGLVVDRFGKLLVVQIGTAGMERVRDDVVAALVETLAPAAILLRNDSAGRALEGLESYVAPVHGDVPDRVEIVENGTRFSVPVKTGQKTGWFFDHRLNRARMQRYATGKRVLDVFSYIGGWGLQAAVAGADRVVCVDASVAALQELGRSADLNQGIAERVETLAADAFEALRMLRDDGQRFDLVVLDPPAFIKRKKDIQAGEQAYRRINLLAMNVLASDGVLVSASCSYHFSPDALRDALLRAGRGSSRDVQILEQGHQGPDHPVHPAIPETDYLKAFITRIG